MKKIYNKLKKSKSVEDERSFKKKFSTFKKQVFNKASGKKVIAGILSLLTVTSVITPAIPAMALSVGNSTTIAEKWNNDVSYNISGWTDALGGSHYSMWGERIALFSIKSTGEPVYCLEPDETADVSKNATAKDIKNTDAWNKLTPDGQTIVTRASIYGYDGTSATTYGYSTTAAHTATQLIIWDAVMGKRTGYTHGLKSWVTKCTTEIENCYNAILDAMADHRNMPTFDKTSVTIQGAGESNAVTVTDTNGVLSQFDIESNNSSVKVTKSGNTLKIWGSGNGNYSGIITATKKNTDVGSALAITGVEQTMLYGRIADPVEKTLKVNVEALTSNLSFKKVDAKTGKTITDSAVLSGAKFQLKQYSKNQEAYVASGITISGPSETGVYTASGLKYTDDNLGWYRIYENSAPTGYINDPTYVMNGDYTTNNFEGAFKLVMKIKKHTIYRELHIVCFF